MNDSCGSRASFYSCDSFVTLSPMFRLPLIIVSGVIAVAMPMLAHAEMTIKYDLTQSSEHSMWNVQNSMTAQDVPDGGMELQSSGSGLYLRSDIDWPKKPAAITINYTAKTPVTLYVLWADDEGNIYRGGDAIRLFSGAGSERVLLSRIRNLPRHPQMFGFEVSPNSRIELQSITLHHWNLPEKLWSGITSFFSPDEIRPYSINFLWGPQFARNPFEASMLWNALPPNGISLMFLFNILIVMTIACAIAAAMYGAMKQKRFAVLPFVIGICVSAWIVSDLHMSAAFISSFKNDLTKYTFANAEEKTFRDRDRLYAFAEFIKPYAAIHKNYVLFAPREWPYVGILRYHTFPVLPTGAEEDRLWVIYNRPDVTAIDGYVTVKDVRLSPKGTVIDRFDDASFLFLVQP